MAIIELLTFKCTGEAFDVGLISVGINWAEDEDITIV
jgi:hypothetical protein